ncbi:MAG: H-X9-DG-CTERM domain-containing protein, partial [Chthoniobacterales bacterium]
VLLALLFPMTQNLLEKGSRATCSGNLRAIGAAFDLLLVENGGAYPSYSSNPDPADTGVWFNKLRPYLGVDDTKGIGVTQPRVFKCPSNRNHEWNYNRLSYGYNNYLGNNDPSISQFLRVRKPAITHPSTTILCADGDSREETFNSFIDREWRGPGVIHDGGANVLFTDGHVEWKRREDVTFPTWSEEAMRFYGVYGRYAW